MMDYILKILPVINSNFCDTQSDSHKQTISFINWFDNSVYVKKLIIIE